jgi:superfamily II DNA/RNA helicase
MFDAATAELLRSAPEVPGLDPQDIPALLTLHYANLVSARLRGATDEGAASAEEWTLERIADTYELITSLHIDAAHRRASAFVAGTAQQILARRQSGLTLADGAPANIDRNRVDPTIAAALLFLAAEQYADAHEAASVVRSNIEGQLYEATILSENVVDLARGQLNNIIERGQRWRRPRAGRDLQEQALAAFLETLIAGLEMLAANLLGLPVPEASAGRFESPRHAFMRVLELSAADDDTHRDELGGNILNAFAGPHHLASLLIASHDGIIGAALTLLPPPDGANPEFWKRWLRHRSAAFPFIWPNHRAAISEGFHQTKNSAVVVLPTGAGKTTISSLKIAGVLARGKKVVFLAPTHALVEQLTSDLQEMFPKEALGSVVSSDFDLLFQSGGQLKEIEIMTPERCLAMLSFASDAFEDVGLLVFDECHLLSPQSGKIRRALDGMLCVLAFNHIAPDADLLFLSAMLRNAEEFAKWIEKLVDRQCVCVDLLWKPSRQARGVVIYKADDLEQATKAAAAAQVAENKKKGKAAKGLRTVAAKKLVAAPWAVWGLQHNWLSEDTALCVQSTVLEDPVLLKGELRYGRIDLKPNANKVAARLALAAAKNGLKSIVFVNTKNDAVSVADDITVQLGSTVQATTPEQERWTALKIELGDLKHGLLSQPSSAVPHNSSMLRLERDLAERMFRRADGAKVIVATPTLAQGLNLPAHLAILAGDKRAAAEKKGREELEAHEILNAAARAGRAGHLANGVVLLIPEPIISVADEDSVEDDVIQKLKSVLPEDDRCVTITDPLEIVLDRLMQGKVTDPDVRYTVNRMAALREAEGMEELTSLFDLKKSLGAFAAHARDAEAEFVAKIDALKKAIAKETPEGIDNAIATLASQSGLSMDLLLRLKKRIADGVGSLPVTVEGWLAWTVAWLGDDKDARDSLLYDVKRPILGACGKNKDGEVTATELDLIHVGLHGWITGKTIAEIETLLGGDPNSTFDTERVCPRTRELIGSVIPRGISFVMGLVSHVVEEVDPFDAQDELDRQLVESLGPAVRKGFDTSEKLLFAGDHPAILSRVQMHTLFATRHPHNRVG